MSSIIFVLFLFSPFAIAQPADQYDIALAQMTMVDIHSLLLPNTHHLNATLVNEILDTIGGVYGSPTTANGKALTLESWQNLTTTLRNISLHRGSGYPLLFGASTPNGASFIRNGTIFPHQIGVAATFNNFAAMVYGGITAAEVRTAGIPLIFGPGLDLATNPLWTRFYESYGEDPFMSAVLGAAQILGMQYVPSVWNTSAKVTVAACAKHFINQGSSSSGQDRSPVQIPPNFILQYFVPPFYASEGLNALTAMESNVDVNGRPSVASKGLIENVLRSSLNYSGILFTEIDEIYMAHTWHRIAASRTEAVSAVLSNTSVDIVLLSNASEFSDHVKRSNIPFSRLNASALKVLELKKTLGLFDPPHKDNDPVLPTCTFGCDLFRAAAEDVAKLSMTLLQNDGLLPLDWLQPHAVVAVVGRACNSKKIMSGGWETRLQLDEDVDDIEYGSTIYQALSTALQSSNITVVYSSGCSYDGCLQSELQNITATVSNATVTVVCIGEETTKESEGIDDLYIAHSQRMMVSEIYQHTAKIATVLVEGRPRVLQDIPTQSNAILMAYLPGPFGGSAVSDILLGTRSPSGRLPITYPKHAMGGSAPYWRKNTDTYDPQWAFGHGLSYTEFEYSNFVLAPSPPTPTDTYPPFLLSVNVTNVGKRASNHTVVLFGTQLFREITPEVSMVKGSTLVNYPHGLAPGQSFTALIYVLVESFAYFDEMNCMKLQGDSSPSVNFRVGNLQLNTTILYSYHWTCQGPRSNVINYTWSTAQHTTTPRDVMLMTFVCFCAGLVVSSVITAILRPQDSKLE